MAREAIKCMASKILFVNHVQRQCGVFQYGDRLFKNLICDSRYTSKYVNIDDSAVFNIERESFQPDIIVYNWYGSTMPWLTSELSSSIKEKQIFIYHEGAYPAHLTYDHIISVETDLVRPLHRYTKFNRNKNDIITIGSFGFGFENKGFEKICSMVQDQFDRALIRLHITSAYFGDQYGDISSRVIDRCRSLITKKGVQLEITTDFITDQELMDFLASNDINLFLYDEMPGRGLSSVIDYVVSSEACFGVNSSSMFRHLQDQWINVNTDNMTLASIIDNENAPSLSLKEQWSIERSQDVFYDMVKDI